MNIQPTRLALFLLCALCCAAALGHETGSVVIVNIDNFAEANRERGAASARLAIAQRKLILYTDLGSPIEPILLANKPRRARAIAMRVSVIRRLGLIPAPYIGGGCILDPGAMAFADGYGKVAEAYVQAKFGADFRDRIEAEVLRRLKAQDRRRLKT